MAAFCSRTRTAKTLVAEIFQLTIECTICKNNNELRQLPCQHMMCYDCLANLKSHNEVARCPFCNAELTRQAADYPVCRLASNLQREVEQLSTALEKYRLSDDDEDERCEIVECNRLADKHCVTCGIFMCYRCSRLPCGTESGAHTLTDYEDLLQACKTEYNAWKMAKEGDIKSLEVLHSRLAAEIGTAVATSSEGSVSSVLQSLSSSIKQTQELTKRLAEERAVLERYRQDVKSLRNTKFIRLIKGLTLAGLQSVSDGNIAKNYKISKHSDMSSNGKCTEKGAKTIVNNVTFHIKPQNTLGNQEKPERATMESLSQDAASGDSWQTSMSLERNITNSAREGKHFIHDDGGVKVSLHNEYRNVITLWSCHDISEMPRGRLIVAMNRSFLVSDITNIDKYNTYINAVWSSVIGSRDLVAVSGEDITSIQHHGNQIYALSKEAYTGTRRHVIIYDSKDYREVQRWSVPSYKYAGSLAVSDEMVYVTDPDNSQVCVYSAGAGSGSPTGTLLHSIRSTFKIPLQMTSCPSDGVIISDRWADKVVRVDGSDRHGVVWSADIGDPRAVCCARNGDVWVWSRTSQSIHVLSPSTGKLKQEVSHAKFGMLGEDPITGMYIMEEGEAPSLWVAAGVRGLFRFTIGSEPDL